MTDEPINPLDEEREAIARIGFTADGGLMHRYLRRVLEGCRATEESGALQRQEGARIFARDLMALMAEGIDSGRRADTQPLAPARTGAIAVTRARGVARRVQPDPNAFAEPDAEPDASSGDAT